GVLLGVEKGGIVKGGEVDVEKSAVRNAHSPLVRRGGLHHFRHLFTAVHDFHRPALPAECPPGYSAMHKRYPRSANFAFELPDVQRGHVVACAVGHICHRSILTGGKPCRTSVDRRWVTIRNHVDPCGVTGLSNSAIC